MWLDDGLVGVCVVVVKLSTGKQLVPQYLSNITVYQARNTNDSTFRRQIMKHHSYCLYPYSRLYQHHLYKPGLFKRVIHEKTEYLHHVRMLFLYRFNAT
jgi:hypothetical protein